ncbi:ferric-rhodotorulic acid/ferric-coprogen receptor FhuE [Pigmentiphaga sp. NML080357]|uniref:ferric-rhodotorulic acid/ferric-coprogen receptor FhuE n=1 Tax=Pigmentiphaga sp. NML080357 TaxID=2008675 RepID=UPI000B411A58|nr:ferric-rhodotorulic acid/ferric-coprogen receptor FhuE [Pigmentiphaga sp. NML080357]OVZ60590.1 ferric-rhodotorulic acid/ferric-coprogen receptor FhuE [Pigmentiphaga sp. NML080357]
MAARPVVPVRLKRLSLCIAAAFPLFASAQQAPAVLPEITVNASRQDENAQTTEGTGSYTTLGVSSTATPLGLSLRDTPQSVTVVTQQRFEDQDLLTITDVVNNTTGISVNQYETHRGQFNARGFDINTLMIDGVPTTWQQPWSSGEIFTSLSMYDRVEVVRGATGLTTGAGDPSAAINMVRKRASSKEFTGKAEVNLGNWNQRRGLVDLSTPVNEAKTVRMRVVGEHSERDSWVDLLSNKSQTLFATLEADLTSNTLLTAGVSYQKNKARGPMWGGLPLWYSDGTPTNWSRSKTSSADWTRWDSTYQTYFTSLEHRFDNDWKVRFSYTRGERKADSHLLYLSGAPDRATGLGMTTFAASYDVKTTQDDVAVQADGPFELLGRKHELAFGYVYSSQKFNADSRAADPAGGLATDFNAWDGSFPEPSWGDPTFYENGRTKQQALYGVARFNVTDPLKVIVGARVTNYKRMGDVSYSGSYQLKNHGEVTPYAGVIYDLNDKYSLYASYTNIFQPQNARDINGRYLDPVVGKAMETGIKGEFLDGRVNASASVFHIKQSNLAQQTTDTVPGTNPPETAYRAVDGATSKGFELEVTGEVAPNWNVAAGYTHFRAKDADGADVNSLYPRRLLRLFTTYRLPGAWSGLTVGGGVNWQGKTYTYAQNPLGVIEKVEQKDYPLVSLMARYEFTKQLTGQLNINNLFDKKYYGMFSAYSQLTYGAPRNVTVSLKYKF